MPFDPASIPLYAVIRCDYQFRPDGLPEPKLFTCLGHLDGCAFCLKATSRVEPYVNNRERLAGVLYYEAGAVQCFDKPTVIEPSNQFPLLHTNLARQYASNRLSIAGQMPEDFPQQLARAVRASVTLDARQQGRILRVLGV